MSIDSNKALARKFIELSMAGDEMGLENLCDSRVISTTPACATWT